MDFQTTCSRLILLVVWRKIGYSKKDFTVSLFRFCVLRSKRKQQFRTSWRSNFKALDQPGTVYVRYDADTPKGPGNLNLHISWNYSRPPYLNYSMKFHQKLIQNSQVGTETPHQKKKNSDMQLIWVWTAGKSLHFNWKTPRTTTPTSSDMTDKM